MAWSYEEIAIDGHRLIVPAHWFWEEFRRDGWEPETKALIYRTMCEGGVYVDIGSWVGITTLWGILAGAERVVALEGNPETCALMVEVLAKNGFKNVNLTNKVIHNITGLSVGFGSTSKTMSSTSAIFRNRQWDIESIRLPDLLRENNAFNFELMKIDVEGAEILLGDDLRLVRRINKFSPIQLSLHPPFYSNFQGFQLNRFLAQLARLNTFLPNGEVIGKEDLAGRILSEEEYPPWGTNFGNFFDVIIL